MRSTVCRSFLMTVALDGSIAARRLLFGRRALLNCSLHKKIQRCLFLAIVIFLIAVPAAGEVNYLNAWGSNVLMTSADDAVFKPATAIGSSLAEMAALGRERREVIQDVVGAKEDTSAASQENLSRRTWLQWDPSLQTCQVLSATRVGLRSEQE